MKSPLVSVVLPFRNAPTLSRAIQSILDQTFTNFELVLVDNGSSDGSSLIAMRYASTDSRVVLINEPKQGVVFAANRGISQGKGKYVARMDADDYSYPDRLKAQVNFLEKNSNIEAVSGLVEYEGDLTNGGFIRYVNWLNSIRSANEIYLNQFVEFPVVNPSLMIRKEAFDNYGIYHDGDFPEDYEFFLRLLSNGVKIQKVDQQILKWTDSDSRLTRTDSRYSTDAFFRIKAKYLARWLKKNNSHHPYVYIWGGGRLSRKRSNYLVEEGIEIVQYIDIKDSENILHFKEIPEASKCFIVSYVSNWGARDNIRSFLISRGFKENLNYILAA